MHGLSGFLLRIGMALASLCLAGAWAQHGLLDPTRTARIADAVLGEPAVREQLASAIAEHVAPVAGSQRQAVHDTIVAAFTRDGVVAQLSGVLTSVHERMLGLGTGPVVVPTTTLASLVGPTLADQVGPVSIPVHRNTVLSGLRRFIDRWLVPAALAAAVALVLALVLTLDRRRTVIGVGSGLVGLAAGQLVLLYLLPVVVVPALSTSPWAHLLARVAEASFGPMIGLLIGIAAAGVVVMMLAAAWPRARRVPLAAPRPVSSPSPYGAATGPVLTSRPLPPVVERPTRFGPRHRRTEDGQDPDAPGDWLL